MFLGLDFSNFGVDSDCIATKPVRPKMRNRVPSISVSRSYNSLSWYAPAEAASPLGAHYRANSRSLMADFILPTEGPSNAYPAPSLLAFNSESADNFSLLTAGSDLIPSTPSYMNVNWELEIGSFLFSSFSGELPSLPSAFFQEFLSIGFIKTIVLAFELWVVAFWSVAGVFSLTSASMPSFSLGNSALLSGVNKDANTVSLLGSAAQGTYSGNLVFGERQPSSLADLVNFYTYPGSPVSGSSVATAAATSLENRFGWMRTVFDYGVVQVASTSGTSHSLASTRSALRQYYYLLSNLDYLNDWRELKFEREI